MFEDISHLRILSPVIKNHRLPSLTTHEAWAICLINFLLSRNQEVAIIASELQLLSTK